MRSACLGLLLVLASVPAVCRAQDVPPDDPAINPPPISLKLDAASTIRLASALSAATGTTITAVGPTRPAGGSSGPGPAPPPITTIDVSNEPFWNLCNTLTTNTGITFQQAAEGGLAFTWPAFNGQHPVAPKGTTWGGFFIYAALMERRINANAQRPAAAAVDNFHFEFTLMADPRIKIASVSGVKLTSMLDSAGKDLLPGTSPQVDVGQVPRNSVGTTGPVQADPKVTHVVSVGITFPFPAQHAKTATLKGEARYQLQDNRTVAVPFEFKDVELPK